MCGARIIAASLHSNSSKIKGLIAGDETTHKGRTRTSAMTTSTRTAVDHTHAHKKHSSILASTCTSSYVELDNTHKLITHNHNMPARPTATNTTAGAIQALRPDGLLTCCHRVLPSRLHTPKLTCVCPERSPTCPMQSLQRLASTACMDCQEGSKDQLKSAQQFFFC